MKKAPKRKRDADMLDEYDFSKGVRGKYAKRYAEAANTIVLDPDVAAMFPDAASVNASYSRSVPARHKRLPRRS